MRIVRRQYHPASGRGPIGSHPGGSGEPLWTARAALFLLPALSLAGQAAAWAGENAAPAPRIVVSHQYNEQITEEWSDGTVVRYSKIVAVYPPEELPDGMKLFDYTRSLVSACRERLDGPAVRPLPRGELDVLYLTLRGTPLEDYRSHLRPLQALAARFDELAPEHAARWEEDVRLIGMMASELVPSLFEDLMAERELRLAEATGGLLGRLLREAQLDGRQARQFLQVALRKRSGGRTYYVMSLAELDGRDADHERLARSFAAAFEQEFEQPLQELLRPTKEEE